MPLIPRPRTVTSGPACTARDVALAAFDGVKSVHPRLNRDRTHYRPSVGLSNVDLTDRDVMCGTEVMP